MLELGDRASFYNIKSFLYQNKKKMEEITYTDALEIMRFPKKLGNGEKGEIIITIGKFGKYIKYDKKNYSIPKKYDIDDINLDIAKEIIALK